MAYDFEWSLNVVLLLCVIALALWAGMREG
jgi:hypothetical protein